MFEEFTLDFKIQEIKVEFPLVIFTDSHTNIINIDKLRELYPNNQLICLGDITFLYAKKGDKFNANSIQYFINNKIPCLLGNHDQFVLSEPRFIGDLTAAHLNYLNKLPRGFKLFLPDGRHYLCYHATPQDLWSFVPKTLSENDFKQKYPISPETLGVIKGHEHAAWQKYYPNIKCSLNNIGRLSKEGHYAILDDKGLQLTIL